MEYDPLWKKMSHQVYAGLAFVSNKQIGKSSQAWCLRSQFLRGMSK
jgi:hypothetical protein